MNSSIVGLGTALPMHSVRQDDALKLSQEIICRDERQHRLLRALFHRSGVEQRRTVIPWQTAYGWRDDVEGRPEGPGTGDRMKLYEQHAPQLAIEACRVAVGLRTQSSVNSGAPMEEQEDQHFNGRSASEVPASPLPAHVNTRTFHTDQITHLVTVTCTGFSAPGVDAELTRNMKLRDDVQRVQVGFMGCHGAINGLRVARGLAAADPDALVLLCAVELCSLHYQMTWKERAMVGNALFADGAAAALIAGSHQSQTLPGRLPLIDCASIRIPASDDLMSWRIGNHGFDMTLDGKVPSSIQKYLRPWLDSWLAKHDMTISDISEWVVHPGGPKILTATETALDLGDKRLERSRQVLRDRGNMSSPTVLYVLNEALRAGRRGPYLLLAFGPGLVAEATLLGDLAGGTSLAGP